MKFTELDLDDDILDGLDIMHFETCTPIQEKAIPIVLNGKDILGSAQTGTGKTAAYLLPMLELLYRENPKPNKVNALILVPTRELAQQIDQLLNGMAYYTDISWIAIYGGNDGLAYSQQKNALEKGGDIAIATPGRLLSLLRMGGKIDFSGLDFLVLDEADRMLDIGFYDDIIEIISYLPKERQTLMFSATFPNEVEKLARTILNKPEEVKIAVSKPAEGITQAIYLLHETQKVPLMMHILSEETQGKAIIFSSSKEKCKDLYRNLKRKGVKVEQIHSDLDNAHRMQVLRDFRNDKISVLVGTDVVARGIDIDDIDLVVNFDVPFQPEDYVHRIGRTARAGSKGAGITLVTPKDRFRFDKIEKFLEKKITRYELPPKVAKMAPKVEDTPAPKHANKRSNFNKNNRNKPFRKKSNKPSK